MKMIHLVRIGLLLLVLEVQTALSQCDTIYATIAKTLKALDQNIFPVDKFTPGCVSQDCPSVSALPCPYHSNGKLNSDALAPVLNNVQSCMSSHTTICRVAIDPIPVCSMGVDLQRFLAPSGINGTLSLVPGTATITGLSHTTLTTDDNVFVYVTISGLVFQGQLQGSVGVTGSDQVYTVNSVPYGGTLNVSLVLTITTRPKVKVRMISKTITADVQMGQLWNDGPTQSPLSIMQTVFNWASQVAIQNSPVPKAIGTFVGTVVANALQTADSNCSYN